MSGWVDAWPSRVHLFELTNHGMSLRSIAREAAVSPTTVSRVYRGLQKYVFADVADRLLSVPPSVVESVDDNDETFVPKWPAVRRIHALLALGWPHHAQYEQCGIRTHLVCSQSGKWITVRTSERISAMYDKLQGTVGPSRRTAGRALKRGYVPPLGWDDIDDPDEWPTVETVSDDSLPSPEDLVEELTAVGIPLQHAVEQVAQRRGVKTTSVERTLQRRAS